MARRKALGVAGILALTLCGGAYLRQRAVPHPAPLPVAVSEAPPTITNGGGPFPVELREQKARIAGELHAAGVAAHHNEKDARARASLESALTLYRQLGDEQAEATVLADLADAVLLQGEVELAGRYHRESLERRERGANSALLAEALCRRGDFLRLTGDYAAARAYLERSLRLRQEANHIYGVAECLTHLGEIASEQQDYPLARARLTEAVALFGKVGHQETRAAALGSLGDVARRSGQFAEAESLYREGLAVWRRKGHRRWCASFLARLGALAYARGQDARAKRLCEESLALYGVSNNTLGRTRPMFVLANVALRSGDREQAEALHRECLRVRQRMQYRYGIDESLKALENVAAARQVLRPEENG